MEEENKSYEPYYVQVDGLDVPTAKYMAVWMSTKEDAGDSGSAKGIAIAAILVALLSAALSVICLAGVI